MISTACEVRGIYAREDECASFLQKGIPTFETAEACNAFLRAHCQSSSPPSNPERGHMTQMLTTLVNWRQVETYLLGARREYDARFPPTAFDEDARAAANAANAWLKSELGALADEELAERLRLPMHRALTPQSTETTLRYLFEHMRSGIFVKISQNKVRMFVPFVNEDYVNGWGPQLQLEGGKTVERYYAEK